MRERTAHYDEGFVSADPAFAHAHVTVLAPFPVGATDRAAAVASEVRAFDYTLRRVATFPDGVVHLVPEPDRGFRALTDAAFTVLAPTRLPANDGGLALGQVMVATANRTVAGN